jgi:carbohydrate-selective porin OprB
VIFSGGAGNIGWSGVPGNGGTSVVGGLGCDGGDGGGSSAEEFSYRKSCYAQCQTSPYTFKNTSYLIFPTLTWFSNTTYNTTNQSFTSLQSITKGDRHILLTA